MNSIPLSVPNFTGNELNYVSDAIKQQWVSTGGMFITRFEKEFADYAKVDTAAAVQSGTAALHLAMTICEVGAGDLIVAPALTFVAAINPIRYVGAEPVFMDCDECLGMDPVKLECYLEEECELRGCVLYDKALEKPIKGIVVVHIFGNGANIEHIMEIAGRYNLPVIEDATEAVGTFYSAGKFAGSMAGTIGDFGAYSFNGNKIITTGGGGMLVSQNPEHVKRARHLSTQAKTDELYYDHDEVGFNYRMTNLQAALGVAQLEQLERFIGVKQRNYLQYQEFGIELLPFCDNMRPNYWFYSYRSKNRDELIKYLGEQCIQARPVWKLIHMLPMYRYCRAYAIERANEYYSSIVNIPCSTNLESGDVMRVASAIKEYEKL